MAVAPSGATAMSLGRNLLGGLRGFFGAGGLHAAITARKLLDAARGVHELLLAREKWMAGRADANADVLTRRACAIHRATCARDRRLVIIGMNACFHVEFFKLTNPETHCNAKMQENPQIFLPQSALEMCN